MTDAADDPLFDGPPDGEPQAKKRRQPQRATEEFTRVPIRMLEDDYPFNAATRLWLAMWNASREGRHKFKLSAEIWQHARLSRVLKGRVLRELEAIGEIRIERNGGSAAPVIEFRRKLQ